MEARLSAIINELPQRLSKEAHVAIDGMNEFERSNLRYTEYGRPGYVASVVPAGEDDVVATVKFCREHQIPFAAVRSILLRANLDEMVMMMLTAQRSGQHCVTTSMRHLQDGLLIDMRSFSHLKMLDQTTVLAGGGVITDDLVKFLQDNKREVTVGSCPTTGITGVFFGAGLGRLQGKYGYLHDNLLSCRVVLANGDVVHVIKDSHADLFWAIRGAGHNFGICLEATFQVYPQANAGIHYSWDLEYSLDQCDHVFSTINRVHTSMPPDLAIFVLWRRESPTGHKNLILVNLVWSGVETEATQWLSQFERLNPVVNGGKVTTTWHDLPWETYGGMNKRLSRPEVWKMLPYKMMSSVSVKSFDLKTTKAFFESVKEMNEKWNGKGWFGAMFECLPNHQTRQLPSEATAFPWRYGSDHFLMMTATPKSLDDRKEFEAHLDAWKTKWIEVSGYGRLQQYVNYGSTTVTVQDPPEALYGYEPWRLEKLRALKRRYDPDNAFRWYQPLV